MRALITGIAGFAGSHLADFLLAETDLEVWGVVLEGDSGLGALNPRSQVVYGDLRDADVTRMILAQVQPDYIFHLAGQAYVPVSWHDPWPTLETNIRTQVNILAAAAALDLDARILVVGSTDEYGRVRPEELPITEETPLRPDSPYAVSKIAQDMLGLQYHLSHGLKTVRVRPFNHIGPRQRDQFVASSFAKQIAEIEAGLRPPVVRVGNLEVKRDFTDVRDMVRAYWLILQHGQPGDVYNIGTGVAHSIREVLDILLSLSPVSIQVEPDPARFRPSDMLISVCDATRLRALTGWSPVIPLAQTLRDVLDFWRSKIQSQGEKS